jgi:hypothetical protein
MAETKEVINPIKITDKETNRVYILDFDRESIKFAEAQGFDWHLMRSQLATQTELLWYCAFRKYNRQVPREKAISILDELGGMRPEWVDRLSELWAQGLDSLIADDDAPEDDAKNAKMTVTLD